jgi:hypothetical protein
LCAKTSINCDVAGWSNDCAQYRVNWRSIVRGIREGLPIRLVAALHDTSVEMIERNYSAWITNGLNQIAAQAVIPLVPAAR